MKTLDKTEAAQLDTVHRLNIEWRDITNDADFPFEFKSNGTYDGIYFLDQLVWSSQWNGSSKKDIYNYLSILSRNLSLFLKVKNEIPVVDSNLETEESRSLA
jgi:hypothetical protein